MAQETILVTPSDSLQNAINQVAPGGVIEIAPGTHTPPTGGYLVNQGKGFVLRATGPGVVLDGGSTREILRMVDSGPVTFEGITFKNGLGTTFNDRSGGVTLQNSVATFSACRFENNRTDPTNGGGGGTQVINGSRAFFVDCVWQGNSSKNFGGGLFLFEAEAWIHDSQFLANRTNLPGHINTATGGGIAASASSNGGAPPAWLRVSNTRFANNQAAFAGGGIYTIGQWLDPVAVPRSDVVVANSTFESNETVPDPSGSTPSPSEGGGIHSENQASVRVYSSRFLDNRAEIGGGVNLFRSITEIHDSVLRDNRATGTTQGGFGGAISATSNDTATDGTINRRNASLTVRDSLIEGALDGSSTVAKRAGCVFLGGDVNRRYGLNGNVPALGGPAENRANGIFENVVIHNCDVTEFGGGLQTDLANLDLTDALIMACDASPFQGGGLRAASESAVVASGLTLAKNTAASAGGGAFIAASSLTLNASSLIENESPSGSAVRSDAQSNLFGQGIAADVTGSISGTVVSGNSGGLEFAEVDFTNGPINDLRYNDNAIHGAGSQVYSNSLAGGKTVAQLNSLTISRSGAPNTDKSQVANSAPGGAPVVGAIAAVPPRILPQSAAGDAASETESFVGFAWSGGSATLNGGSVSGNSGLVSVGAGTHTLEVDSTPFTAVVENGSAPTATFTASPSSIDQGESATLSWSLDSGTFVDMAIDQGISVTPAASGMVVVSPSETTTYRLFVITEEGGVVETVTVQLGATIFTDGFESGDVTAWTAAVGN